MNKNNFLRIKKLLKFAYNNRYSDFYRKKYKKAGFNPITDFKSIKDIKKIPFLSKKELLKVRDPFKLLFVNEKDMLYVRSSSGTTGKPLYLFYSKFDRKDEWLKKDWGRVLYLANPINTNHYSLSIRNNGFSPFFGDIHNLPATAKMADELKINTIYFTPTLAIILSDYLKNCLNLKKSLKYLNVCGELLTLSKKKFIQKLYPGVMISSNYGAMEMLGVTDQCRYLATRTDSIYFHPQFDLQHIEIINPDTERGVASGERGELVVTSPNLFGTPMIRYKTGDLISIQEGKMCPCGFSKYYLQVFGRANYDIVKAGGFELRREFLEKVIDNLKNLLKDSFEAHIYENFEDNKPKIRIVLNLSLKKGVQESPLLKQRVEKELLENWQVGSKLNLRKAIEMGLFEPVKINFVDFPVASKAKKTLLLHQI